MANDNRTELVKSQLALQKQQAENFGKLLDKGLPLAEKWIMKSLDKEKHAFSWANGVYLLLMGAVVLITGYLALEKIVSSESFAFIMGTIIGATLTYVRELLPER